MKGPAAQTDTSSKPSRDARRALLVAASLASLLLSACSCGPNGKAEPEDVDFDKADSFACLEHLCRLGPRAPGTRTAAIAREWLVARFKEMGAKTQELPFKGEDPPSGRTFDCVNIFASLHPDKKTRVLLATHWDTRLWAERDPDPERRNDPIPGANDGASGVAVLLELCRIFAAKPPAVGVDFLLTDGEDLGKPGSKDYCQGAKHFVRKGGPFEGYKPLFAIVVDLVGDKELVIRKDAYSRRDSPELVERIWKSASDLGYGKNFPDEGEIAIQDDHLALHDGLGIPAALLLDWNYGPGHAWFHTHQDTPDKCSPESLETVGRTVARVVYFAEEK